MKKKKANLWSSMDSEVHAGRKDHLVPMTGAQKDVFWQERNKGCHCDIPACKALRSLIPAWNYYSISARKLDDEREEGSLSET